jgi:galactonate dehydratase
LKISKITVYKVKPRWIFVKLSTDEGIDGWGEMISGTKTETVVAGAYEVGNRFLIGKNPFEIERLFQEMHRSFFRGGPIHGTIVSGLEMALWGYQRKSFKYSRLRIIGREQRVTASKSIPGLVVIALMKSLTKHKIALIEGLQL